MLKLLYSTARIYAEMGGAGAPNNTLMLLEAGDVVYGVSFNGTYWCASRTPTRVGASVL